MKNLWIFLIIALILIIIFIFLNYNRTIRRYSLPESFTSMDIQESTNGDKIKSDDTNNNDKSNNNKSNNDNIESKKNNDNFDNLKIDTLECNKKCCGNDFPESLDNLSPTELLIKISARSDKSQYPRTNYMCGNGSEGSGCPCFSKAAYQNLLSRGIINCTNNASTYKTTNDKSIYVDNPRFNDLEIQRQPHDITKIEASENVNQKS